MVKKKSAKKSSDRVTTGIKGLDGFIEGGFKKNSSNFLGGATGTGKTIFATQFLIEGIKKGEKCLFISFEEKKKSFYEAMNFLSIDLEKLEKEKKFFFLEYTPQKIKTMLDEGGGTIESLIVSNKITRVSMDDAGAFMNLFKSDLEKKESVMALFNMFKLWECSVLFVSEERYDGFNESLKNPDIGTDSIIFLYLRNKREQRERFLEVLKMRGTNHSLKNHKFHIQKNGITMGQKPIARKNKKIKK